MKNRHPLLRFSMLGALLLCLGVSCFYISSTHAAYQKEAKHLSVNVPSKRPRTIILPDYYMTLPSYKQDRFHYSMNLTASYNNESYEVKSDIISDGKSIRLEASLPIGIKVLALIYDKNSVHLKTFIDLAKYIQINRLPDPRRVMADISLAFLPASALRGCLPRSFSLKDLRRDDGNLVRVVYDNHQQSLYVITYKKVDGSDLPTNIDNEFYGYQIAFDYTDVQNDNARAIDK